MKSHVQATGRGVGAGSGRRAVQQRELYAGVRRRDMRGLRVPFGHEWSLASRIEDLSPTEIHQRAAATFGTTDDTREPDPTVPADDSRAEYSRP